jgi:hypothetical protein
LSLRVRDAVPVRLRVRVADRVRVRVTERVRVPVADRVRVPLALRDAVSEAVRVRVGVGAIVALPAAVRVCDAALVGVRVEEARALDEPAPVALGEPVPVALGKPVPVVLGEPVPVALGKPVPVALGKPVPLIDALVSCETLALTQLLPATLLQLSLPQAYTSRYTCSTAGSVHMASSVAASMPPYPRKTVPAGTPVQELSGGMTLGQVTVNARQYPQLLSVPMLMNDPEGIRAPVKHVKLPVRAGGGRLAGHGTGVGSAEGVPLGAGPMQLAACGVLHPSDAHMRRLE